MSTYSQVIIVTQSTVPLILELQEKKKIMVELVSGI